MSKSKINLSKETIDVMKNLSSISQHLLIEEGNRLRTISHMENILCEIEVEEHFPRDFGIYDLNEFWKVVKYVNEPTLDFSNEKFVVIESGDSQVHYYESDPDLLVIPPKGFNDPEYEIHFPIPETTVSSVLKLGKKLCVPDLLISSSGDKEVKIRLTDRKNSKSNCYSEVLHIERPVGKFLTRLRLENLKVIPDDYEFYLSPVDVSKWVGSGRTYWIAMERKEDVTSQIPRELNVFTHWTEDEGIVSFDFESMDEGYEQLKKTLRDLETKSVEMNEEMYV